MYLFDTFVTSYQEPFCPFPYTYFDIVFKFNLKKNDLQENRVIWSYQLS